MSKTPDSKQPGDHGVDSRDLADVVVDAPERPVLPSDDEGKTDRAIVIGRDGRWAAGWALRFIIFVVAGYIALEMLGTVWVGLLPILLAILVSTFLWPTAAFLRHKAKFPPALAAVTTLLGFIIIFTSVLAAMAPIIRNQSGELADQASEGVNRIFEWAQGEPFNLDLSQFDGLVDNLVSFIQGQFSSIASGLFTGISAATSVAVTLVVMLVLTFFFLKDGDRFLPWMRRNVGANAGWHLSEVLTRTWNTLSGFIRTQALVSFVDAAFIGVGLMILGVPLAFVLAVITFFAGFIPIVGAVTAGALAVIIALVTNGFTNALMVLLLILLVQQLEGNVLQPILQSKAMNLHAAIVLLSVMVGSTLFGIIGAFLAVPIAATLAVWFRYHSELVALRAGEITIDDIEIATAKGSSITSKEALDGLRERFSSMSRTAPGSEKKDDQDEEDTDGSDHRHLLPRFRKVSESDPE